MRYRRLSDNRRGSSLREGKVFIGILVILSNRNGKHILARRQSNSLTRPGLHNASNYGNRGDSPTNTIGRR